MSDNQSPINDRSSFRKRSQSEDELMSSIACLAQDMVHAAAQPIKPGATIKAQLRTAAKALGYPDGDWRVRAAWYGEAGSWSAKYFLDLKARHEAWKVRQEQAAKAEAALYLTRLELTKEARIAILSNTSSEDADLDQRSSNLAVGRHGGAGLCDRPVASTGD